MTSTLPELNLDKLIKGRRETLLNEAIDRRENNATRAHYALEQLRTRAGMLHKDPTDMANAEADLMEAIADRLEESGGQVIEGLERQQRFHAEQEDQIRQLTGRAQDAERELDEQRRSALRASSLEIELNSARAEIERLENENDALRARNTELEDQINRPNPLKAENDSLKADKRRLEGENRTLRERNEQLEQGLQQASDIAAAPLPGDPPAQAPGSQPDPAPVAPEPESHSDEGAREGIGGLRFQRPLRRSRRDRGSN